MMTVRLRKRNILLFFALYLIFFNYTEILAQKNPVIKNAKNQSNNHKRRNQHNPPNRVFNGTIFNVSGGGIICDKQPAFVYLDGSENDVLYRLFLDGKRWGPTRPGTGDTLVYSIHKPGTYTIEANKPGYTGDILMEGNAIFSEGTKIKHLVLHGDTSNNELDLYIKKSQLGITYQLEVSGEDFGDPLDGNKNTIYWNTLKLPGEYKVYATNEVGCIKYMHKSYVIEGNPVPFVYNVIGGGEICEGDSVIISLTGSQIGFTYQLIRDTIPYSSPVNGTDSELIWSNIYQEGYYSVEAINGFGDKFPMYDSARVIVNPLPEILNLSGEGEYCANDSNVYVSLSSSNEAINYELYKNGVSTGSIINGAGSEIHFPVSEPGIYTIKAENASTGCAQEMADSVEIIINPLPIAYELIGGGETCVSGPGLSIKLSNSDQRIKYVLYNNNDQVSELMGTGNELNFGEYMDGKYSAVAIDTATNCEAFMNGEVDIKITYVPQSPDSLQLSNITATSVTLSWLDQACNENGYEIYRSNVLDEEFLLVNTINSNIETYRDEDLYPNRTYYYKVRALNDSSYSDYSNVAMTTTLSLTSFIINTEGINTPFNYSIDGSGVNSSVSYVTGGIEDFSPEIMNDEVYVLIFTGLDEYKELIISFSSDSNYVITNITTTVDGVIYPLSNSIYEIANKNTLKLKELIKLANIPDFEITGLTNLVYHSGDQMTFIGLENYPSAVLSIYDSNRVMVKTATSLTWDGTNEGNIPVIPGSYLYEVSFQNISETKINGQFIVK